jgi:uncharacterized protein YdhG (YjbR/CyaY superfamily)
LEAPEVLNFVDEDDLKSEVDETRTFTIKDFKEKAERVSHNLELNTFSL